MEPPHVHVQFGGEEVRINLQDGSLLDPAPKGHARKVRRLYRKHLEAIRAAWERYHPSRMRKGRE